jgi:hypothetical protein
MVTLADELHQHKWKEFPPGPMRDENLRLSANIAKAERFVISDSVMEGALSVARKRPTSIIQAWDFVRPPYDRLWLEWDFRAFSKARDDGDYESDDPNRPNPGRVGWLIERDGSGNKYKGYTATFAWGQHIVEGGSRPNVATFGINFYVGEEPEIPQERKDELLKLASDHFGMTFKEPPKPRAEDMMELLRGKKAIYTCPPDWAEAEAMCEVTRRLQLGACPYRMELMLAISRKHQSGEMSKAEFDQITAAARLDIEGEPIYLAALLILLNSKNATQASKPKTFDALNKKRKRFGKKPILSFVDVDIRLGAEASRGGGSDEERAAMRRHWVRGHFKVRKTGCFWWSPYARGAAEAGEVRHRQYNVKR